MKNVLLLAAIGEVATGLALLIVPPMELDQPLGGMIRIFSEPMTQAVQQLAK